MTDRVGIWLVGARGAVATTAIVGAAAVRSGLAPPTGLVTALPAFSGAGLPGIDSLVFGGHELDETSLLKQAEGLASHGVLSEHLLGTLAHDLIAADAAIRPGIDAEEAARSPEEAIQRVGDDLKRFRSDHDLARVVVVNVSTTEPPLDPHPAHATLDGLRDGVCAGRVVLPPSCLYAYAAFDCGCSFVDFTPSTGARLPALDELARRRGAPHAGRDAKTGETLVKTALAPMFAARNLTVRSWVGTNLLGGGDGAALAQPARAESKVRAKEAALRSILGSEVETAVLIEYVETLGVWKTAWDHIAFEGFLGTTMRMQLIWEGCDPALAAPLVLDLGRLTARAHETGLAGPLAPLAFFFKDPVATGEHRLEAQFRLLCDWAAQLGRSTPR